MENDSTYVDSKIHNYPYGFSSTFTGAVVIGDVSSSLNKLEFKEILQLLRENNRDENDINLIIKAYISSAAHEDKIQSICRKCGSIHYDKNATTLNAVILTQCDSDECIRGLNPCSE